MGGEGSAAECAPRTTRASARPECAEASRGRRHPCPRRTTECAHRSSRSDSRGRTAARAVERPGRALLAGGVGARLSGTRGSFASRAPGPVPATPATPQVRGNDAWEDGPCAGRVRGARSRCGQRRLRRAGVRPDIPGGRGAFLDRGRPPRDPRPYVAPAPTPQDREGGVGLGRTRVARVARVGARGLHAPRAKVVLVALSFSAARSLARSHSPGASSLDREGPRVAEQSGPSSTRRAPRDAVRGFCRDGRVGVQLGDGTRHRRGGHRARRPRRPGVRPQAGDGQARDRCGAGFQRQR